MAYWYDSYLDDAAPSGGAAKKSSSYWYDDYLDKPPTAVAPEKKPEEMSPLGAGYQGSRADLSTMIAKGADVLGFPETAQDWLKAAEARRQKVAEQYHPKVPSFEDIGKEGGVWNAIKDTGQYAYEKMAESAPQMAALGAAGVAGALAAPAAIPGAVAGLGAAALADVPFFTGSNLKAQMETGKSLKDTSLGTAAAAAVPQSLLDVALGEVLPGVGRAVAGRMVVRAAKKAVEGAAIEGVSEGLQQAIEIGQADPAKLYKMDKATQKEILEAAIAGGLMGGTVGGVSGAAQKRLPAKPPRGVPTLGDSSFMGDVESPGVGLPEPTQEESASQALPPEPTYYPNRTGLPQTFEPDESKLGLGDASYPIDPDTSTKLLTYQPGQQNPDASWRRVPMRLPYAPEPETEQASMEAQQALSPSPGIPPNPNIPAPPRVPPPQTAPLSEAEQTQASFGLPSAVSEIPPIMQVAQAKAELPKLTGVEPTAAASATGQKVYKDMQQQLLAAGMKPIQANANALIVRKFYERLATRLGQDAFSVYKERNLQVQRGDETTLGGDTFNQDKPGARPYSQLGVALERAPMKKGTGQQWTNLLTKLGVKPEELAWSNVGDLLTGYQNKNLGIEDLKAAYTPYQPDVYERGRESPADHRGGFSEFTLGGYGEHPESNYREVILSAPGEKVFESNHWHAPNPLVHYRTTDRSTPTGDKALFVEEIQSDWHQQGRKRGYRGTDADMLAAFNAVVDARKDHEKAYQLYGVDSPEEKSAFSRYLTLQANLEENQRGVPNAPFKETWPNLALKHALMDAINQGKQYLAWPTGEQMAEIQGHNNPESETDMKRVAAHKKFMDERIVNYANKLGKPYGARVEKITVGPNPNQREIDDLYKKLRDAEARRGRSMLGIDSNEADRAYIEEVQHQILNAENPERHTVHALRITPQMRDLVGQAGLPLFQGKKPGPGTTPRGNITFTPDQTIIRLFSTADPSTFMHEAAHLFLNELRKHAGASPEVAADLHEILQWLGAKDSASVTRQQHEKFARSFELYLREGKAPSKSLADVFKRFAEWLGQVYARASSLNVSVPPNIRKTFDRMLAQSASLKASTPKGDEFKPGRMPKLDPDTFSQSGLAESDIAKGADLRKAITASQQRLSQLRALARSNPGAAQMLRTEQDRYARLNEELLNHQQNLNEIESFDQSPLENHGSVLNAGNRAWNFAKQTLSNAFTPFNKVPGREEYLDVRNLTAGQIAAAEDIGRKARDLYAKVTQPERDAINSYMTGESGIEAVPQKYRTQTKFYRDRLDELGSKLVDKGVLHPETYEKNKGKYLPRLYLMHLIEHEGITGGGMRANMSWARKRNQDLSLEARTAKGEITHPSVSVSTALMRLARDNAVLDYLGQIYENDEWARPRSLVEWQGKKVTPQWLLAEAEEIDSRLGKKDRAGTMEKIEPEKAAGMREIATRMREAAHTVEETDYDSKEWKQLPNTRQYGALRGAWVRNQIADDITGMTDFVQDASWAAQLLGDKNSAVVRLGQMWKAAKVPWNISAQARNGVSNMIQSNFIGGVPLRRVIPELISMAKEIKSNGPNWQMAKKWGMTHGTMAESELHALADMVSKGIHITDTNPSALAKVGLTLARINQKVTGAYGGIEAMFKAVVMKDAIQRRGMAPNKAAQLANMAIGDYSAVPPSIKYLRNAPLGMPFITWQYVMLPAMAKTILTKQGAARALPYVAFMAAVPAIVASMNGLKGDDPDRLRMALSDALRRQNNMFLMPYKDQNGRWQFVDLGYFFPWQMPMDVATNSATGEFKQVTRSLNLFSHPVINVLTALNTGIDPFTQRPIADKRDPLNKQVMDVVGYVWSLAMPSVLANYGAAGKALDKLNGTGMNRYGEPTPDWTQIGARLFGVNIYPVIPEAQRARNLQHMQSEIQQVKSRMTYELKDRSLTSEQRQRMAQDYVQKLRELSQDMIKYSRESAMTPSLRAASARP